MMNLDIGLLLLRLTFGGTMLFAHGIGKLAKFGDSPIQWADPIGIGPALSLVLASFAEVVCSLLVMVGFRIKLAVWPLIATMVVAFFIVHGSDPWGKKEMAFLYGLAFLVMYFTGAGKYSLDRS